MDQNDIDVIWTIVDKFTQDTGWKHKTLHTVTLVQFCKSLIANSNEDFGVRVQGALDDIEDYYDRVGKLRGPNMWAADLACKKWLAIWGIHDDEGRSAEERLRESDEIIARENALAEYRERFYPESAVLPEKETAL